MDPLAPRKSTSALRGAHVAICLMGTLGSLAGCGDSGPQLAPVRGQVLMDDKPLAKATLEFSPEGEGSTSLGVTDKNGYYELGYTRDKKGAMIGWHTVDIYHDPDIIRSPRIRIPHRYNVDSELREEVVDDDNVINFELRSEE